MQIAWMHGVWYSTPMWRRNLAELLTCHITLQFSITKFLSFPIPLAHQCEAEIKTGFVLTALSLFLLFLSCWWVLLPVIITIFSIKSPGQTTTHRNSMKADTACYQDVYAKNCYTFWRCYVLTGRFSCLHLFPNPTLFLTAPCFAF